MAKQAIYLKYRPRRWNEVVEQDAIKQILDSELKTGKITKTLLFTGGAGTGKTTSARIFASEIEQYKQNVYEINCADHTGVDDVRQLVLDPCKTKPLMGTYKIFILDECHMLTTQSQNALLKILEEPPIHCIFIMCTTDPQKVLPTIMSRATRYDFQLISHKGIVDRLNYVLQQEQQDPDGCGVQSWGLDSLDYIATIANGHMRDALNILQKCVSYTKVITSDVVVKVLGVTNQDILFDILDSILARNEAQLLEYLDRLNKTGIDLKLFVKNFLTFVLDVNKYVIMKVEAKDADIMSFLSIPRNFEMRLVKYNTSHKPTLKHLLKTLLELNNSIKWETNVKPVLETNLLMEIF